MVCKRCGQSVDDSVFVCEHCGTVLMSGHVVPMRKEPAMGDEPKAKTGGHKVLRIISIVAVIYLIVVVVVAAVDYASGQSLLLGVWENEELGCITFMKNGAFLDVADDPGSYKTDDGKLFLVNSAGQEVVYHYEYQFGAVKDTLKLENDEESIVFHRYR